MIKPCGGLVRSRPIRRVCLVVWPQLSEEWINENPWCAARFGWGTMQENRGRVSRNPGQAANGGK